MRRAGVLGKRLEVPGHRMGYFANIHFVLFELQLAGGYAGHVEKRRRALDEEGHQPINLLQALGQLFRREVAPLGGLTQKSDATDDRGHWISQFVRCECQEAIPCRDLFGQARVLFGQFPNLRLRQCRGIRPAAPGPARWVPPDMTKYIQDASHRMPSLSKCSAPARHAQQCDPTFGRQCSFVGRTTCPGAQRRTARLEEIRSELSARSVAAVPDAGWRDYAGCSAAASGRLSAQLARVVLLGKDANRAKALHLLGEQPGLACQDRDHWRRARAGRRPFSSR